MDINNDGSVSTLAAQLEKADNIMNNPNNIDTQGSTVPIRNNSSSSSSTLLYAINDKMRATAATTSPSTTTDEEGDDGIEFTLPPEITIAVFGHLSIQTLLVCQRVSRHFRVFARTVMLDKLGSQAMGCQRLQCPLCRRNQQQQLLQRSSGGSSTSAGGGGGGGGGGGAGQHGSSGLPPLPYHHLINNPNTLLPTTVPPVSHHNSYLQPQDHPLHQLHHHLYQHQSTEDMSHHQTDLHIHHQSHSYHDQPSRPVPTFQQSDSSAYHRQYHVPSSTPQYHHTASYVAPGNIALFLFPYNDHTPTSWQDRQSVHLVCTGIDRHKEQLVFSPIYPEVGDCLKFNTNSWNIPSTFASSGSFGDGFATSFSTPSVLSGGQDAKALDNNININDPRSTNRFATTGATTAGPETTYSTRLDLFDYATGRPRFPGSGQANADSLNSTSYSFANQFNRPHSRSPSLASISSSISSSSSFSSTPSSPPRQSQSSPTPSWANVSGNGGEHYSVIGIKHGDWPEDRQAAGRWWGGGLHSSMTQESMVYMPWAGASSAFDFHQGSSSSSLASNGRTLNNSNSTLNAKMENVSPASSKNGRNVDEGCTKIHKHHMYLPSTRAHKPPGHHHRFMCLHHDQIMTGIAASSSSSSSSSDSKSKNPTSSRATKMPLTTAGSTHLEVDYSARVTESKRCLFCLSTPCKANLEIQVKFDQLRVSLDWILSGFGPDQTTATSSAPRSNGGSAIADALAMGSVRQGQVPS